MAIRSTVFIQESSTRLLAAKPIPGFEKYLATADGRIYSTIGKGKFLKPQTSESLNGYFIVGLYNGGNQHFLVHRLVAQAWVNNLTPMLRDEINHKDSDKANNHPSNLEWVTRQENLLHYWTTPQCEKTRVKLSIAGVAGAKARWGVQNAAASRAH